MKSSVFYKVTPFNLFALGTCYEYNFIPMYTYFGGTSFEYFVNKLTYCYYTNDKIGITTTNLKDLDELLENQGLEIKYIHGFENDILNKILTSLDEGKLIMIRVSNVESYEVDTGYITEKSTSEHWVLCFGYSMETQELDVLEHRTNISAKYSHCRIKYGGIVEGYQTINEPDTTDLSIVTLEKKFEVEENRNFKEKYIDIRKEYQKYYTASNECIFKMLNRLSRIAENSSEFDDDYVTIFTELLKYYQREIWLLNNIGCNYNSSELIKQLNLVRSLVMKCNLYPSDQSYGRLNDHIKLLETQITEYNSVTNSILEEDV